MGALRSNRRLVGMILLLVGLLLLGVGFAYLVRSQAEGAALREQLRENPASAAEAAATPVRAALEAPTETATQGPTATLEPTFTPTASATAEVEVTPASEPATALPPATPSPTAAPTATATAPPAAAASGVEPVRLVFPDLKIDTQVTPMYWQVVQTNSGPVSEWVIPKNEAGHHINSSKLGEPGNLVISGHNNIYGQVFRPISQAWDNDTRQKVDDYTDKSDLLNGRRIALFDAAGREYDYVVTEFYRLKDTGVPLEQRIANGRYAQQTPDTRLTIITCWPPTNNTHRLIVIAVPAAAQ